jgi:hypothetical protein
MCLNIFGTAQPFYCKRCSHMLCFGAAELQSRREERMALSVDMEALLREREKLSACLELSALRARVEQKRQLVQEHQQTLEGTRALLVERQRRIEALRLQAAALSEQREEERSMMVGTGVPALHRAAEIGDAVVVDQLIAHRADVNVIERHGRTPLHVAAKHGHASVVEKLIAHNCDVNAADFHGWTALHRGVMSGQAAVVKLLVARGADIHAADKDSLTPRDWSIKSGHAETLASMLSKGADVVPIRAANVTIAQLPASTQDGGGSLQVPLNFVAHPAAAPASQSGPVKSESCGLQLPMLTD